MNPNTLNQNSLIFKYTLCNQIIASFNRKYIKIPKSKIKNINFFYLIRIMRLYLSERQFKENVWTSFLLPADSISQSYLSKILENSYTTKKTFPIEKEILNTLNLNYLSSKNKTTNLESFRRK